MQISQTECRFCKVPDFKGLLSWYSRVNSESFSSYYGTFNRYVTLKGGSGGNPFCYGAFLEGEGGSGDTVT